jgi:hypothetical protein
MAIFSVIGATTAQADLSCVLTPALEDVPTTLLMRDLTPNDQAVILVSGRTLVFDCPSDPRSRSQECYGETEEPMRAPTQLNIASEDITPGSVVVVTTRNLFFGKNYLLGTNRRHTTVHVFTIQSCEQL